MKIPMKKLIKSPMPIEAKQNIRKDPEGQKIQKDRKSIISFKIQRQGRLRGPKNAILRSMMFVLMFLCTRAHAYEYTCETCFHACEYTCVTCTGPFGASCRDKSFDRVPWLTLAANDTVTEGLENDHGLDGTSLGLVSSEESGRLLAVLSGFEFEGLAVKRAFRPNSLMMQNRVFHSVGMTWLVGIAKW